MAIMAAWGTTAGLLVGTALLAIGASLLYPALLLLALGGAPESERGSVVGTFSSFFDLSQGLGSVLVGVMAAATSYQGAFALGARVRALGFVGAAPGTRRAAHARHASTRRARSRPSIRVRDFAARDERLPAEGRRDPDVPLRALAAPTPERDDGPHDAVRRRAGVGRDDPVPRGAHCRSDSSSRPRPWRAASTGSRARSVPTSCSSIRCCRSVSSGRASTPRRTSSSAHGAEVTVYGSAARLSRSRWRGACCAARRASSRPASYPAERAARVAGRPLPTLIVPPGVDRSRFVPLDATERRAARQAFGLDPDAPLVVGVSRLVPRKGFDVLLDAVAGLPGVQVAIAGTGRDEARLRRRARRLGGRAVILGGVDDARLPLLYGCRGRVRDAVSRPVGRPRGRGLRHRVRRGRCVRRSVGRGAQRWRRATRSSTARRASSWNRRTSARSGLRSIRCSATERSGSVSVTLPARAFDESCRTMCSRHDSRPSPRATSRRSREPATYAGEQHARTPNRGVVVAR